MLELPKYGYCPIGIDILASHQTAHVGSIANRAFVVDVLGKFRSLRFVLHIATLHKPHVDSHQKEDFIATNIAGTLVLLEEASKAGIEAFIFTSTTSTFGAALSPKNGQPAAWIDESVTPIPKNIYGVTKIAAEDMCQLIHNETQMPVLVLRVSRFFPEADDAESARLAYQDDHLKVCELLYRRVDIADVVSAHVCGMKEAATIGWGKYIISAPSPFPKSIDTLTALNGRAVDVIKAVRPTEANQLSACGYELIDRIDRVYDSSKAIRELKWEPKYTFERAAKAISQGEGWRSQLAVTVGKRGYHCVPTGIYTS